ncbi:MAG: carbohydrate-binding protein [Clostridiales bacterium]|jgi:hypothetical protein|nr:carbohydrate-binding protein [Clostridiales bacterium]
MITLEIKNKDGAVVASARGERIAHTCERAYAEGDFLSVTAEGGHLVTQLDGALTESMIYLPSGTLKYTIPFGEKRAAYGENAFAGAGRVVKVRYAAEEEIRAYRNIALNSADKRGPAACYPHATANFVTRDESVFEERNAIDGHTKTDGHGSFPYQSWGGGAREDLDYKLDFGRTVEADKIVFYLRADYAGDHDTYWRSLTVELSDGTVIPAEFQKTGEPQTVSLGGKKSIEWLRLTNFKQAAMPLSWAALTEIEVYGADAVCPAKR